VEPHEVSETRASGALRALVIAPLAAPVLYWAGAVLTSVADSSRPFSLRTAASALAVVVAVGAPISYAAAGVAAIPAVWMLRRWGNRALSAVLLVGAIAGALTALIVQPYLRGELFSVILTSWHGAVLGSTSACLFWWLCTGFEARDRRRR
jgi:hypothetical protein